MTYFKSQILELKLPGHPVRTGQGTFQSLPAGPEPYWFGAGRDNLQFLLRRSRFSVLLMNACEEVQKYQTNTHRNSGIRNIEGWPMKRGYLKIEKIDHLSISESVYQVPNRSTQNQREGKGKNLFIVLGFEKEKEDDSNGIQGDNDKEQRTDSPLFSA
jgi:hypothetical protein